MQDTPQDTPRHRAIRKGFAKFAALTDDDDQLDQWWWIYASGPRGEVDPRGMRPHPELDFAAKRYEKCLPGLLEQHNIERAAFEAALAAERAKRQKAWQAARQAAAASAAASASAGGCGADEDGVLV